MNYLEEAINGSQICIDELRVSDMVEIFKDYNQHKDTDIVEVLVRVYYAGYSVGFKDATGVMSAKMKADQEGGEDLEIKWSPGQAA